MLEALGFGLIAFLCRFWREHRIDYRAHLRDQKRQDYERNPDHCYVCGGARPWHSGNTWQNWPSPRNTGTVMPLVHRECYRREMRFREEVVSANATAFVCWNSLKFDYKPWSMRVSYSLEPFLGVTPQAHRKTA